MARVALILVDHNDEYVACCSNEQHEEYLVFMREEDGKKYRQQTTLSNSDGKLIAIICKEVE